MIQTIPAMPDLAEFTRGWANSYHPAGALFTYYSSVEQRWVADRALRTEYSDPAHPEFKRYLESLAQSPYVLAYGYINGTTGNHVEFVKGA